MPGNGNWLSRSAYFPLVRQHVRQGSRWAHEAGTDYWLIPGAGTAGAAGTTSLEELAEFGWTATALTSTAGSGSEFMTAPTAATNIPPCFDTTATGDILLSPAIFGDFYHAHTAMVLAGQTRLPKKLV